MPSAIRILPGRVEDVPVILSLIQSLADYEKLSHQVVATEADLRHWLFGDHRVAEVIIAWTSMPPAGPNDDAAAGDADAAARAVGFALFFHNFSTFLGKPGLYLEDLFVVPEWRGRGVGRQLLARLASLAVERGCGRVEWSVLDWNAPAIGFYRRLGAVVLDEWRICRMTGEALAALARE